jgi:LPXTG-motif cell wall-anchored protein
MIIFIFFRGINMKKILTIILVITMVLVSGSAIYASSDWMRDVGSYQNFHKNSSMFSHQSHELSCNSNNIFNHQEFKNSLRISSSFKWGNEWSSIIDKKHECVKSFDLKLSTKMMSNYKSSLKNEYSGDIKVNQNGLIYKWDLKQDKMTICNHLNMNNFIELDMSKFDVKTDNNAIVKISGDSSVCRNDKFSCNGSFRWSNSFKWNHNWEKVVSKSGEVKKNINISCTMEISKEINEGLKNGHKGVIELPSDKIIYKFDINRKILVASEKNNRNNNVEIDLNKVDIKMKNGNNNNSSICINVDNVINEKKENKKSTESKKVVKEEKSQEECLSKKDSIVSDNKQENLSKEKVTGTPIDETPIVGTSNSGILDENNNNSLENVQKENSNTLDTNDDSSLPKTGEERSSVLLIIGIVVILAGGGVFVYYKKNR